MKHWETKGEKEAIKLIDTSMDVRMPDNQLGMPDACYTKIHYIKKAIEELEKEIKVLKSTAKEFNIYGVYNNNNNDNNIYKNTNDIILGGKRSRKTRKMRKTRYSKKQ